MRGYSYESLGVKVGDATTGGRVLGVASAEYVITSYSIHYTMLYDMRRKLIAPRFSFPP